jgi:hypothetical protein
MRKLFAVLVAGLFLFTLSSCGSSSNKAKTAGSDTDSSDTDSSDTDSSDSDSGSDSDSSSNGGGDIQAFCDEIKTAASSFNDIADVPSDSQIDTLVKELLKLKAVAPDAIAADMKTFVDLEVAAARAAKAAADNSDAQESAANTVLDKAGEDFFAAATKVDDFATKQCGTGLSGETASDSVSSFSTTGSSIN